MTDPATLFAASLDLAGADKVLRQGDALLFPTETFYGLGCDAFNDAAVAAVFALKRRLHSLPLPVVVGSLDMLERLAREVTRTERDLMERFWPGPLSLLLAARPEVPELLTGGTGRVAVRFSSHPAACDLCDVLNRPVVASSANISGQPPVAEAWRIAPELQFGTAGLYARGPEPEGGLPSTVLRVERERSVRIVRPGVIDAEALGRAGLEVLAD